MINTNRKLDKTRVSLQDVEAIKNEIKLEALIKKGRDISKMVEVKITNVTSIFIQHGKSKEAAKRKFMETHKNSIF